MCRGVLSHGARTTIAVVTLYALVLQAFLAGMLPTSGSAHGFAELCAPIQDGGGAPPRHDGPGCCTLACAAPTVPPSQADASIVAWPRRATAPVVFAEAPHAAARGPPLRDHSPRGPPPA